MRQILDNLRVLVARINSATGNPVKKDRIQKTILLQARFEFSDSVSMLILQAGKSVYGC
jgi:hypothetical protein